MLADCVLDEWDDLVPQHGAGYKGPPSAPPAIPPIIINPFSYHSPGPRHRSPHGAAGSALHSAALPTPTPVVRVRAARACPRTGKIVLWPRPVAAAHR